MVKVRAPAATRTLDRHDAIRNAPTACGGANADAVFLIPEAIIQRTHPVPAVHNGPNAATWIGRRAL